MNEPFLHYLWKFRLCIPDLSTTQGETLVILHPGTHNHDEGPDFANALIRIGDTTWAGNVEIHVKASDWYAHRHERDHAYRSVILHVVYENDRPVYRNDGEEIPTLQVNGNYPESIYNTYQSFVTSQKWIPCFPLLEKNHEIYLRLWSPALSLERLTIKAAEIRKLFFQTDSDWEETLFQWLGISFGFRINALPFELLTRSITYRIIQRHSLDLTDIEALLFGQAGMLNTECSDQYVLLLKARYARLSEKYHLSPCDSSLWKYLRLRPANFPTLRISQFASLLRNLNGQLISMIEEDLNHWNDKLLHVSSSSYWNTHYTFGRLSGDGIKYLGESSRRLILINGVIPFTYFYGEQKGDRRLQEKALHMLDNCPPEENSELRNWSKLGIPIDNALFSQSLIHLRKNYCHEKRCLECRLGRQLLNIHTGEG